MKKTNLTTWRISQIKKIIPYEDTFDSAAGIAFIEESLTEKPKNSLEVAMKAILNCYSAEPKRSQQKITKEQEAVRLLYNLEKDSHELERIKAERGEKVEKLEFLANKVKEKHEEEKGLKRRLNVLEDEKSLAYRNLEMARLELIFKDIELLFVEAELKVDREEERGDVFTKIAGVKEYLSHINEALEKYATEEQEAEQKHEEMYLFKEARCENISSLPPKEDLILIKDKIESFLQNTDLNEQFYQ